MGTLILVLGVALLASGAVALTGALGIAGRACFLAAALVVAATMVVGESIVLSLARWLTPVGLLVAQSVWLVGALALWRRRGCPRPPAWRRPPPRAVLAAARARPLLALLGVAVVVALGLQATLAVAVAPNEPDSIAYHLPRAAFWVQNHSALQYRPDVLRDPAAPAAAVAEQVHPPNAELLVAWTMALSRSDRYAQLVQWLAMIGVLAVIFAASRLVGLSRSQGAFAAGLFALMPAPLIESATTQNDLVLTFFLGSSLLFGVIGLRERARGPLVVAALAAGLASGTKLDVVLIVPGALVILGPTLVRERLPRSLLAFGAAVTLAALIALGSFAYIQNEVDQHRVTGFSGTPSGDFVKTNPARDALRVGWNMLDAPGLPQPDWLSDAGESVVRHLFGDIPGSYFSAPDPAIRSYASADDSAYGLLGLLVVLPLMAGAVLRRRAPSWQRLLALSAAGYFLAYVVSLGYNPETGRYLMPAVALAAPLLGLLADRRRWAAIAVALALATAWEPLLHETYKPVLASQDGPSIFALDRLGQQTLDDDSLLLAFRRLGALVGPHAALGFVFQDMAEYPLFGEPLQRRLVGLRADQVTPRAIGAHRLVGVFIGYANQPPCRGRLCLPHTAGLRFTALGGHAYLVTPAGRRAKG